jgi:hypothetical protein
MGGSAGNLDGVRHAADCRCLIGAVPGGSCSPVAHRLHTGHAEELAPVRYGLSRVWHRKASNRHPRLTGFPKTRASTGCEEWSGDLLRRTLGRYRHYRLPRDPQRRDPPSMRGPMLGMSGTIPSPPRSRRYRGHSSRSRPGGDGRGFLSRSPVISNRIPLNYLQITCKGLRTIREHKTPTTQNIDWERVEWWRQGDLNP